MLCVHFLWGEINDLNDFANIPSTNFFPFLCALYVVHAFESPEDNVFSLYASYKVKNSIPHIPVMKCNVFGLH